MPLIATRGAASAQGFGEFAQTTAPVYIEDVFSTFLYTGTGATQTITNGIDLSGKGGLVWLKSRSRVEAHGLFDTARGANQWLSSNLADAQTTYGGSFGLTSFNGDGFTIGTGSAINFSGATNVSWTFREQPKFFDVVTYTGDGTARTISHNLGSAPGCIIIKSTSSAGDWAVYHRGATSANTSGAQLNSTDAFFNVGSAWWNSTAPTSTVFSLGTSSSVNSSGVTYVAYLFAHDAGGFGLTGTDNVITCGTFTTDGSGNAPAVTLGYEPQWVLWKSASTTQSWVIYDTMRFWGVNASAYLLPNGAAAEATQGAILPINATGFGPSTGGLWLSSTTYIYVAIRRGPMKTPTSSTGIFTPDASGNNAASGGQAFDAGFPVDFYIRGDKSGSSKFYAFSRLMGNEFLTTTSTAAGGTSPYGDQFDSMTGIETTTGFNFSDQCAWLFRRAPGYMDVVCYTGNGSTQTVSHNLGVAPELMIVKKRQSSAIGWFVYSATLGANARIILNLTDAVFTPATAWNSTSPTSTVFSLGVATEVNASADTFVAYLFATVAGVSKVGSYTGTGTTQVINCGFTAGSRFVMIKRTDSTGDWYVWDSARGIVAGNDPYLLLNSTAAEVTSTDYVDTANSGFEISSTAPAAINANGGTFIFLAIA